MPRRNIFGEDKPEQKKSPVLPENQIGPFSSTPIPPKQPSLLPDQPIDMIPAVKPKRGRNRNWDKAHPAKRFRKVDPGLIEAIGSIAEDLNVPNSEVAQAFLEFGFDCYQKGLIDLVPNLEESRRTLYPQGMDGKRAWKYTPGEVNKGKVEPIRKKKKDNLEVSKRDWEIGATWRLGDQIGTDLHNLAGDLHVPIGEVINVLGKFGLDKYSGGELTFEAQPLYPQQLPIQFKRNIVD